MVAADRTWAPESPAYDAFFKAAHGDSVLDLEKALTAEIDINALQGNGFEGTAALHMAASSGNMETIKLLLAHGADINILEKNPEGGYQPIHMAAYRADPNIVKFLLDSGSERDRKGMCERTPLYMVLWGKRKVEPHHVETIVLLLDYGLDVDESGLYQATSLRDLSLMKLLLDRGASVSPVDGTDSYVLYHAATYADYTTVQFLLNHFVRVGIPICGVTSSALLAAALNGKIDVFNLLLAHADKETIARSFRALHLAATFGHTSLVELMLDLGFEIEAKDDDFGNTPLHSVCAASEAYPDVVRVLLSRGADVNATNRRGETPLHAAAWRSDPEVVKLLLHAGADINARKTNGQTPLMSVASQVVGYCLNFFHVHGRGLNPRFETFKLLINAGSDATLKDLRGRTALHELVVYKGSNHTAQSQLDAAMLLLQNGVDAGAVDAEGKTASQSFKHWDHCKLRRLLLDVEAGLAAATQRGFAGNEEPMIKVGVGRKRIVKL